MAQLGDDSAYPIQQAPEEEPVAQVGKIADEWRNWMQEPGNRSSLMQFGIQLMQPIGLGQTVAGHFGQAIGAAGEAGDRVTAQDLAERRQSREDALAGSRIDEREGKLKQGETALEIKQQREDTRRLDSASRIRTADDRAKLWTEQAAYWAARAAAEPGNAEAKRKLQEAQTKQAEAATALKDAQTLATPHETEIRRLEHERKLRQGDERIDQGQQRIDQRSAETEIKAKRYTESTPDARLRAFQADMATRRIMLPQTDPSLKWNQQQWEQNVLGIGGAAPQPQTGAGTPKVGQEKQFKQGVGVWDGTKWVPKTKSVEE